jgi:hypothetical protein
VVEGEQPDRVAERVDQDGVLRVQVHDGVHVGAGPVGALVQLPLGRRPLGAPGDGAVQGDQAEVGRRQAVEPRAGAGDDELRLPWQPRRQVAAAGQHQTALDGQPADLDQLPDRLVAGGGRPHPA